MTITSAKYMPLLLGPMQIGTMHSSQRELLVKELIMRAIDTEPKELLQN